MEVILLLIIGVFLIYRMMRVEERMNKLEHGMFRDKQDALWTEELEKQYWAEQPPEPFATPEEVEKYNIDGKL
jgi:hypothetical protein